MILIEPQTIEVLRTYLQLSHPDDLKPAGVAADLVRIEHAVECPASFFRYLYREVGRNYHWVDRLAWTDEEIQTHLARDVISLWVMYHSGAPAGYFELERHDDGSTEIAYFGLLPEFIGRELGKHLLTAAARQAWASLPNRVWLHTCTLDDPAALPNYLKRGFMPVKQETYLTTLQPGENLRSASPNVPAV
jgi:ribosomal protein S18 acetylase RimI-like enzyme